MNTTERLRALLTEATPGPWVVDDTTDQFEDYMAEEERDTKTGWFRGGVGQVDTGDFSTLTLADATIAVEAVNTLPALLDVVEAARDFRGYVDFGRLRKGGREANARYLAACARLVGAP